MAHKFTLLSTPTPATISKVNDCFDDERQFQLHSYVDHFPRSPGHSQPHSPNIEQPFVPLATCAIHGCIHACVCVCVCVL